MRGMIKRRMERPRTDRGRGLAEVVDNQHARRAGGTRTRTEGRPQRRRDHFSIPPPFLLFRMPFPGWILALADLHHVSGGRASFEVGFFVERAASGFWQAREGWDWSSLLHRSSGHRHTVVPTTTRGFRAAKQQFCRSVRQELINSITARAVRALHRVRPAKQILRHSLPPSFLRSMEKRRLISKL